MKYTLSYYNHDVNDNADYDDEHSLIIMITFIRISDYYYTAAAATTTTTTTTHCYY